MSERGSTTHLSLWRASACCCDPSRSTVMSALGACIAHRRPKSSFERLVRLTLRACLLLGSMTFAACSSEGELAVAERVGAVAALTDKVWSNAYGLAHDAQVSGIAINASGPVAMAWWQAEFSGVPGVAPFGLSCTLWARVWQTTGGWGSAVRLTTVPALPYSYVCDGLDVHANSAGDVLVVANSLSRLPATVFRRLATDGEWRQEASSTPTPPGMRALVAARLTETGDARWVEFQYPVDSPAAGSGSYRYVTRLWGRSGTPGMERVVDVTFRDEAQVIRPIYSQTMSIDRDGNVLVMFGMGARLWWSHYRSDRDDWAPIAALTVSGEREAIDPAAPVSWTPDYHVTDDSPDGKPWLLTHGAPPDAATPVELRAMRFDPEVGWRAGDLISSGYRDIGLVPAAVATLADGRAMLVYRDDSARSASFLRERVWTPEGGWSLPRIIARGAYGNFDPRVALSASGDAVVAFRDCAVIPRIPIYEGYPSRCVIKASRLRDFGSPDSAWTTPEVLSMGPSPPDVETRDEHRIGVRDLKFLANGDAYLAWWRSATYTTDWELWLQSLRARP